ncbi:arginase [Ureibacillus thermophilus]|uniref:Arginase n=1 Tax=Ureibacillus thermophilus TaxID=367743 RepID=A0A4P6UWP8_9BACL|nr:arginase [Ureibacillus thermophilus]QBK27005.1 arginase [Ureibacillus thermophilus]
MASLLSIDWDYFISAENQEIASSVENKRTIHDLWYKKYFQYKSYGKDFEKFFSLSDEVDSFWDKIKQFFKWDQNVNIYVSDSHALSYKIAEKFDVEEVYLFDAHSDLGYGGLDSLKFEVNCANWLGKLLQNGIIKKAYIIYSPFTKEKPEFFKEMNKAFSIDYIKWDDLYKGIKTSVVHICRSGAWSPPWFDGKFAEFVRALGLPYKVYQCPNRRWNPNNISFAEKLEYMMA